MIYDVLEVFRKEYEQKGDKLILDNYVLKDGLYVMVGADESLKYFIFTNDKKQENKENCFKDLDGNIQKDVYEWFKERDYYSSIINDDTNKSVTSARYAKILSTNYLSFFFRHSIIFEEINNKLYTKDEITDEIFLSLDVKQSKALKERLEKRLIAFSELWEIAEKHYYPKLELNAEKTINYRNIVENVIKYIQLSNIETDYIKIFIDENIDEYKRVQALYWKERIFNKNDFNIEIENEVFGLSNSNISFSVDKPFNEHKTTKFKVPFRISQMDAISTKIFFDWLENQDVKNKYILNKYYLYLNRYMANQKDLSYKKEIKEFDYLPIKIENLDKPIHIINFLQIKDKENYEIKELFALEAKVDEIFYNKQLKHNYFRDDLKVSDFVSKKLQQLIFETKYAMANYFKKFDEREFHQVVKKYGTDFVIEHLRQNREYRAKESLNLKFSLLQHKGEILMDIKSMEKIIIRKLDTSDYESLKSDEFFYLCGQVASYLLSKKNQHEKMHDLVEPFLRANNAQKLKKDIEFTFFKYKHAIHFGAKKINTALALIEAYEGEDKLSHFMDSFLVGYLSNTYIFKSSEEN